MTHTDPPTALETPDCPPHDYKLDCFNVGICRKCGDEKDFGHLHSLKQKSLTSAEKAARGGRKTRERFE